MLGDTWEYDGHSWIKVADAGPEARRAPAMAYDAARGVTVLFGGRTSTFEQQDTWEWDGKKWTQVVLDNPPPRRAFHAMAYDSDRKTIVMFGGRDVLGNSLGDTWEFACAEPCYPDLDGSGTLDLFDFLAFANAFNAGDAGPADCDASGALDLFDFLCFVNAFNAGC